MRHSSLRSQWLLQKDTEPSQTSKEKSKSMKNFMWHSNVQHERWHPSWDISWDTMSSLFGHGQEVSPNCLNPQSLQQWICENHPPQRWDRYESKGPDVTAFLPNGIISLGTLFSQVSILALFIAHIFLIWEHNDSFINLVNSMTAEIQQLSSFAL